MKDTQEQMAKFMREQGEDISVPEITMDMVEGMFLSAFVLNPRFVYEFFDLAEIILIVRKEEDKWYYELDGDRLSQESYATRLLAETAGFKEATIKHEKRENGEQN